jgi:hypothetical protein
MNNELKRMWKEAVVVQFKVLIPIFAWGAEENQGLPKTKQEVEPLDRDAPSNFHEGRLII